MPSPTDTSILDEYGNNAAIRCPACKGVFIFSRFVNRKKGRECPHCHGSRATLEDGSIAVVSLPRQALPC